MGALGLSSQLGNLSAFSASPERKPNIVVIMTDDAGYSDLGCYGGEFPTPNIDALASDGVRFRTFYNFARCSPTRACLLTGHHPQVVGVGDLCGDAYATEYPGYIGHLNEQFPTVADLLKTAGYHTMISGKWHQGGEHGTKRDKHLRPLARGFDRYFGFLDASTGYFSDSPERHPGEYWLDDRAVREDEFETDQFKFDSNDPFYATDAYTKKAMNFIGELRHQSADQPFFLYLPFNAPHNPREATEKEIAKYIDLYDSTDKWRDVRDARHQRQLNMGLIPEQWKANDFEFDDDYYHNVIPKGRVDNLARLSAIKTAQLVHVDDNVGRLVSHLKEIGEFDNTIILYFSDNGSAVAHDLCNIWSTPYRGAKGQLEQGGIATHCIAHWPSSLKSQGDIIKNTTGSVLDLVPTFLEIAGVDYPKTFKGNKLPPLEGRNLLPVLNGQVTASPDYQYWDLYGHKVVIEKGRWKWLSIYDSLTKTPTEYLYDLDADVTKMHDLKHKLPSKCADLKVRHMKWA